jgi:Ca2+-binding RTX toxin-like protein
MYEPRRETTTMATIPGGTFGDVTFGSPGDDVIHVGDGRHVVFGFGGDDEIFGGHGSQLLLGGHGAETLVGGTGDQLLFGNKGDDLLIAGTGNQILAGGAGDDALVAGTGHDTFVFGSGGGRDVVMDFQDGDVLQIQKNINGLNVSTARDLVDHIQSDADGNAVLNLGQGDSVTLVGVKAEDVQHNPSAFIKVH